MLLALPRRSGATRDMQKEGAARATFYNELTPNTKYTLSEAGKLRVDAYVATQAIHGDADVSLESTWADCFNRLVDLDAFPDAEFGYDQSLRTVPVVRPTAPEPDPEPEQDLEDINTGTREGERSARELVLRAVQGQARAWWDAFCDYVMRKWGYSFTDKETAAIIRVMEQRNLNFLSADAWDKARRTAVRNGWLPSHLLTEDEKLGDMIASTHDLDPMEEKRQINLALQRLNG